MKIRTDFIYPPIPFRNHDWCAVDDDTYDGHGCPIGYGATEAEAIKDLLEQIGDREHVSTVAGVSMKQTEQK
jgi:hypothetical protein